MKDTEIRNLLHSGLQNHITEKNWKKLTEIQKKAIPQILTGLDCIVEAPTAGGKTEAVFFPSLTKVSKNKMKSVQVLYLAPLKALLNDIELRAKKYAELCGLHCFMWHGDVGQKKKIDELKIPSQLLLTTPESLEAIMLRKAGWELYFKNLVIIIIDEAHNFASNDRGSHLISLIERLEWFVKIKPQRIAISATIGNPEDMLSWLAGQKREKGKIVKIVETEKKKHDYEILFFNEMKDIPGFPKTYANNRYLEYLYFSLVLKKSIVFAQSRTYTERIAGRINQNSLKAKIPLKVRTHHSSVSKYYREEAENKIKIKNDLESGINSIISTSTLELGIDIGTLDLILQMGSLVSSSSFLQRVGRTGRRKGTIQVFRGICLDIEPLLLLSAVVNLGLKKISEAIIFPKRAFHILSHQIICLSLQTNGISPQDAWEVLKDIHCFSKISKDEFYSLIKNMIEKKFFRDVDGLVIVGEKTEKLFLSSHWRRLFSVFDTAPLYEVWNEKKHVGNLDASFVEQEKPPEIIILGGIEWKIIKIRYDARIVSVKKIKIGEPPKWGGHSFIDVPYETAKEVGKLLFEYETPDFLNDEAEDGLLSAKEKYKKVNWSSEKWVIWITEYGKIRIWTFAGDKVNRALGFFIGNHPKLKINNINYKFVEFTKLKTDELITKDDIVEYLQKIKREKLNLLDELIKKTLNIFKPLKFSKFSSCLPPLLSLKTLMERAYDFKKFFEELDKKRIVFKTEKDSNF